MTERVIRVILDPSGVRTGSRRVESNLRRVDRSARRTSQSVNAIGRAAALAVSALGVREIIRYADSFRNVGNRIRLVVDSQEQFVAVQRRVLDLANETRTDLETTAQLYERVARASGRFGLSQNEVFDIVRSVGQAAQISGASTAESSGAIRQFTQALAGGVLRAEEFNSIIEQTPRLASAIEEGLGLAAGTLRSQVVNGGVSAAEVLRALQKEAATLDEEFAGLEVTVGSAFVVLQNSLKEFVGTISEGSGATSGLSTVILELAGFIRGPLITGTQDWGDSLAIALEEFDSGLDTTDALLREFGTSTGEIVGFVGEALTAIPTNVVTAVRIATVELVGFAERAESRFTAVSRTILASLAGAVGADNIAQGFKQDAVAARAELEREINAIQAERTFLVNQSIELEGRLTERIEARRDAEAAAGGSGRTGGGGGGGGGGAAAVTVDPAVQQEADARREFLDALRQTQAELAIETALLDDAEAVLLRYSTAIEASALGNAAFVDEALSIADAINAQEAALVAAREEQERATEAQERAQEVIRGVRTEAEIYAEQLAELQQLLADGLITPEVFDRAVDALDNVSDAFATFLDQARRNAQDTLGDALAGAFNDGADQIGERFALLLVDLASQFFASEIFKLLGSLGGGDPSNGFLGAIGSFFSGGFGGGAADGADTRAGETFVVGEEGPELFTAPSAGRIIPNNSLQPSAPPEVNVSVVNSIDPQMILGVMGSAQGSRVILNTVSEFPSQTRDRAR